jgi:UTP--glucose-1-phosphate uridylyltransferase
MNIKKAVITSAGFGTRFLPITKTIQKEMLPILNRPLVDYVVEDCIKAGITEIIFVISEHNTQLIHFYQENQRLYNYLKKMNKLAMYEQVRHLHEQATFTFVRQKDDEVYGTATPVKLVKEHLKDDDAFIVFMGDDFIFNADGSSEAQRMIDVFNSSGARGLATCVEKPNEVLHKYGIAEIRKENGYTFLTNLVEKPAPGTAPSNLVNMSKYIFTPEIFDIIDSQSVNPSSGELYITDSITQLSQKQPVVIHTPSGEYLDGGYVMGWLRANLVIAKSNPELAKELQSVILELFPNT